MHCPGGGPARGEKERCRDVLRRKRCRPRPSRHLDSGCHSDETVHGPGTCRPRDGRPRRVAAVTANRTEMDRRRRRSESLLIRGHALTRRVREETHGGRTVSGAVALLIAVLTGGCDKDRADATGRPAEETPRSVRIVRAEGGKLPRTVVATGTLAAEDQVVLNTKVAGRLAELPVDLGSVVRAGDVVAVLDLTDFELRVEQARTALAQARARLGVPRRRLGGRRPRRRAPRSSARRAPCWSRRSASASAWPRCSATASCRGRSSTRPTPDFRVAEARYQEALEEVRNRQALRRRAARGSCASPSRARRRDAAGTVRRRGARAPSVGRRHTSTSAPPVVTIVRMHPLRLRLAVPEREAASVRVGPAGAVCDRKVTTPPSTGRSSRLSPAVDESTRTLLIEAEVPNADGALRPGRVRERGDRRSIPSSRRVLVPADALVDLRRRRRRCSASTTARSSRSASGSDGGSAIASRCSTGWRRATAIVAEPGNLAGRPAGRRATEPAMQKLAEVCIRRPVFAAMLDPGAGRGRRRGLRPSRRRPLPGGRHPAGPRARHAARRVARGDGDRGRAAPRGGRQHRRGHRRAALHLRRRRRRSSSRNFEPRPRHRRRGAGRARPRLRACWRPAARRSTRRSSRSSTTSRARCSRSRCRRDRSLRELTELADKIVKVQLERSRGRRRGARRRRARARDQHVGRRRPARGLRAPGHRRARRDRCARTPTCRAATSRRRRASEPRGRSAGSPIRRRSTTS